MEHRYFSPAGELLDAFLNGYTPSSRAGLDGSGDAGRRLDELMQSFGTIVWVNQVGDHAFEEQGRRTLARTLELN